jgi:hypothetical protein
MHSPQATAAGFPAKAALPRFPSPTRGEEDADVGSWETKQTACIRRPLLSVERGRLRFLSSIHRPVLILQKKIYENQ